MHKLHDSYIIVAANTSWGLYNFRKNLILSLLAEGYRVVAISSHDDYLGKLQSLGCECINIGVDSGGKNPFKDIKTIIQLFNVYRKIQPLVVLHFTPKICIYSSIACSLNNISFISNISGLGVLSSEHGFLSKLVKFLYKLSQRKASKVFFQNEIDRSSFIDSKIVAYDITDRLPGSGVDLDYFTVEKYKKNTNVKFILVARMLYAKGIVEYVDAAKHIKKIYPNVKFYLLGPADVDNPSAISQSTIDSWSNKGYIDYLGSAKDIRKYLSNVDCVVLPSYYAEGVPKSLLEAGAMGKIIVTTDTAGCRDTVDEGVNGFLCAPKNVEDLINKLEVVINMIGSDRIHMGLNSRKKMEKEFDEKIVLDKYKEEIFQIYNEEGT
jgi:glycosyltransferase involved in cell wall biosynthesis